MCLVLLHGSGHAAAEPSTTEPSTTEPGTTEPSAAERETARTAMDDGDRLRADGDLRGALARYEAADRLMHVPTTGIEVARAQAALGLLVEARASAIETANLPVGNAEPSVFTEARQAARQLADELVPRIPSLVTQVTPSEAAYTLSIDGVALPAQARALPFKTNPGTHVVVVQAQGFESATEQVVLAEGEQRSLPIALAVEKAQRPTPAAVAAAAGKPEQRADDTAPNGGRMRGYIALGGGGLLLGAGAVTGILSLAKTSDAKQYCDGTHCPPLVQGTLDNANTLANVANVTIPLGVLAMAYGLYELLSAPSAQTARAQAPALSMQVNSSEVIANWRGSL